MGNYVGSLTEIFFVITGPRIWSELPENVKTCDTINIFNIKCKNWLNQSTQLIISVQSSVCIYYFKY